MKGIAGIVYPDVFQVNQTIHPMLVSLQSGSDERYGMHAFKNFEIGSCAAPLSCNEKKNIYVSMSGYLDNQNEIEHELRRAGFQIQTLSDEEIILLAYERWGRDFASKIKGSFAIAILDQRSDVVLLARDSVGKQTLYWYQDHHHFVFSNQLRALLSTGFVPQTPAPDALAAYLYFGYCPQDLTPIKGVNKLLPGHILELNRDRSIHIQSYWSFSSFFERTNNSSLEVVAKELDHLLSSSIKMHIPKSTEPFGCIVSGGLGSTATAYYLQKLCGSENVRGISVGFSDENEEDILVAHDVTEELEISQRRLMITPQDFLNDFVKIVWHLDEPLADPNVIATWNQALLASEQSNIAYTGMGSDELFAGHMRYSLDQSRALSNNFSHYITQPAAHWLAPLLNLVYKPAAYSLLKHIKADAWQISYMNQNALFTEKEIHRAAPKLSNLFQPELFLNKFHNLARVGEGTTSLLYFDVKTRLPDLYILQYQKLMSAHNLLWYSPFLYRPVIEFAAALPEPKELESSQSGKYLKAILHGLIPDKILNRPKLPRPSFLASWVDRSPQLQEIFVGLRKSNLVDAGYISEDWIIAQTMSVKQMRQSFRKLWAVFALEVWYRLFINQRITDTPPDISIYDLFSKE